MKNTTNIGRNAEDLAAGWLVKNGYKIIGRNWRHPHAEIDILAKYKKLVLIVEVKFRASNNQGGGLAAIGEGKISQLHNAAQYWRQQQKWSHEITLAAIEVDHQGNIMFTEIL